MFDKILGSIKSIATSVCKTLDSFSQINMHEHINEPLCFVGIKNYKITNESYIGSNGTMYYNAVVKICVDLLSSKTMEADELADIADSIIQSIFSLGIDVSGVERKPCEYSKAHCRYVSSIELEATEPIAVSLTNSLLVMINGAIEPIFTSFKLKRGIKTSQTAVVNKVLLSSIVREEPDKLTLIGKVSSNDTDTLILKLSTCVGTLSTISLGTGTYPNMTLTSLDVKTYDNKTAEISAEFTEVNA